MTSEPTREVEKRGKNPRCSASKFADLGGQGPVLRWSEESEEERKRAELVERMSHMWEAWR